MTFKNNTEILKETMSKDYWHQKWIETYIENSKILYDMAFDRIKEIVWNSEKNSILDAGCGNGVNTIRLVERNFKVTSIDFSDAALKLCKNNLLKNNIKANVTIEKDDLLHLRFLDNTFNSVLCWGVLMHIQELEKALCELNRVIVPGGYLILCEVSKNAIDTIFGRIVKKIFNSNNYTEIKNSLGIETWTDTDAGRMLVRKTNIAKIIEYLSNRGFSLIDRFPGQFTQSFTRVSNSKLKKVILNFNRFWFKYVGLANPSLEQILIFKKNDFN
ncbi:MAG: class I SAM-dependent methyltransferase [Ignavibacteriota bacterium]|nr:class I SAM-dependent methyltransferase [Ignavibacteriota bacterium]MCO6448168.1 class I SAM-dependent methyltransferase [Ignavibacterium album]MCZ2267333.1 class I SAM-dependent methyltransferase [Ignavibacteriales bacterium]QKJ99473.1 MAG: class I SAM-dependent methyltransferase [Ignavibacteriota bacterium]HOJ06879.1 class I SAM-dependent methyltransferase [Ignavibacteriaceae bacterium]